MHGFISWFYIWPIVPFSVLWFRMAQKKNERICVLTNDCTRPQFCLSFKMTPTLYQSNTMLAIPYGENESCIFVCYNTLRFVDTEIVRDPVRLHIYHWSKICWGIAGKVTLDQWNDSRVKFRWVWKRKSWSTLSTANSQNLSDTSPIGSSIREHSIMHNFLIRWTETQSAYFTFF